MAIKINKPQEKKPNKIKINKANKTSGIKINKTAKIKLNRDFQDWKELDDDKFIEHMEFVQNEEDIVTLYENHPDFIYRYAKLKRIIGLLHGEEIDVFNIGKLNEMYIDKSLAAVLLKDPILSHVVRFSEYMREGTSFKDDPVFDNKAGLIFFSDIPEPLYIDMMSECRFSKFEIGG